MKQKHSITLSLLVALAVPALAQDDRQPIGPERAEQARQADRQAAEQAKLRAHAEELERAEHRLREHAEQMEQRMHHLEQAINHLREGGFGEQADSLQHHADQARHKLAEQREHNEQRWRQLRGNRERPEPAPPVPAWEAEDPAVEKMRSAREMAERFLKEKAAQLPPGPGGPGGPGARPRLEQPNPGAQALLPGGRLEQALDGLHRRLEGIENRLSALEQGRSGPAVGPGPGSGPGPDLHRDAPPEESTDRPAPESPPHGEQPEQR